MADTDIPEFIEVAPGDLIRADDVNGIQRAARNSVRNHRHTRPAGVPADDAATRDDARQIGADEIAPGAVTTANLAGAVVTAANLADAAVTTAALADDSVTGPKLADATVTADKLAVGVLGSSALADGAVTTPKLAPSAVTADKLGPGSVTSAALAGSSVGVAQLADRAVHAGKIAMDRVNSGSGDVLANSVLTQLVLANVTNAKATLFFPTVSVVQVLGAGTARVSARIILEGPAPGPFNIVIEVANSGTARATVVWFVWTFAP